jgi:NAD(P)-dependent dehydrogenase (short-subunit alcohol dehydrogenase family)
MIAARRKDKSQAVVRQIEELGAEGLFFQAHVSKCAEVEASVEETLARFGRLDCAVNYAVSWAQCKSRKQRLKRRTGMQ